MRGHSAGPGVPLHPTWRRRAEKKSQDLWLTTKRDRRMENTKTNMSVCCSQVQSNRGLIPGSTALEPGVFTPLPHLSAVLNGESSPFTLHPGRVMVNLTSGDKSLISSTDNGNICVQRRAACALPPHGCQSCFHGTLTQWVNIHISLFRLLKAAVRKVLVWRCRLPLWLLRHRTRAVICALFFLLLYPLC